MKSSKKSVLSIVLAAVMALSLAACGAKETGGVAISGESLDVNGIALRPSGEAGVICENNGFRLVIPLEYNELLNVTPGTDGDENGVLFAVAEKASVEAAENQGLDGDGYGELFAIGRISTDELNKRRCYDMSWQEVFAEDADGNCYMFYHPTDVRFYRETTEQMTADQEQWTMLNGWAWEKACASFIAENSGLTALSYGNSPLDMYLARAAYQHGTHYTLGTPEFGEVEPGDGESTRTYVERLTRNATLTLADDSETPDGEYVALSFPDEDHRFDFFLAPGGENYVRDTWDGGESQQLFKAVYADGTTKASEIVMEWYEESLAVSDADADNGSSAYVPDDLIGTWAEKYAHRGVITIAKGTDGKYDVLVEWSASAYQRGIWEMTAEPFGEGGEIAYENGKYLVRTFTSDTEYTDEVQYENGTGTFYLNSAGEVMWQDNTSGAGDDSVFVNAG
ncbi:MAG: hypothetical protein E7422_03105 [Ruminococcaceae bacterium]|nr:hypothetical protein [Oscillospiraceae bacterium]